MLRNKRKIDLITIFLIILISMFMLTGCGNRNNKNQINEAQLYEEPIKNLVEGLGEANSEKLLSAFPDFIRKYLEKTFTTEYLQGLLAQTIEEYGNNIKMSYKIVQKSNLSEEELKSMQETVKESYNADVTISNGVSVVIEITTKGDKLENTDTNELNVFEINGKWCILEIQL